MAAMVVGFWAALLRYWHAGRKAESDPCRVGQVQTVGDVLEHGKVLDFPDASFEVAHLALCRSPCDRDLSLAHPGVVLQKDEEQADVAAAQGRGDIWQLPERIWDYDQVVGATGHLVACSLRCYGVRAL